MYQQQCKPLQTVVLFYVIYFFSFGSQIIPLRALLYELCQHISRKQTQTSVRHNTIKYANEHDTLAFRGRSRKLIKTIIAILKSNSWTVI